MPHWGLVSALHPHADATLAHGRFGTPAPKTGGDAGNACTPLRVLLAAWTSIAACHACCARLCPIVWCALSCSDERRERAVCRVR
jgi:hypothetical protein